MAWVWMIAQVFLFGPAGANLLLKNVHKSEVGYTFVILVCGILIRIPSVFLATVRTNFNVKEKLLIAIAWCSKGSLPALLGSVVYSQAV